MPRKIISASRRTDLPAFYSRWLLKRIEQGFCEWIHPFGGSLRRVSLRPEDCLALVFWTRHPAPLLPALKDLRAAGYTFYFQFTLTGYPRMLESHTPELDTALGQFRRLADLVGSEAVIWRYDPVILGSHTPPQYHVDRFSAIASALDGVTRQVYFSFVDEYGKTRKSLDRVSREHGMLFDHPEPTARRDLALRLRDIAESRRMALRACCEDALLEAGIEKGHCVDIDTVRRLRPDVEESVPRRPSREECGCSESVDIGAYDTCPFGCSYCYATRGREVALGRFREHDAGDTLVWRPPSMRGLGSAPDLLPSAGSHRGAAVPSGHANEP